MSNRVPLATLALLALACVAFPAAANDATARTPAGRPFRSHYHHTARYLSKPLPKPPFKVAVIDCEDMVTSAFYEAMKRRVDEALDAGCTMLIFEITTPGGLVSVSDDIMQMLMNVGTRVHTVAYIPVEASSAGVFIAMSCHDIVMGPTATTGSAAVVAGGGEIDPIMRKKLESKLTSQLEILAETNGYPPVLCKSMSIFETSVFSIKKRDTGEIHYFDEDDLPDDGAVWDLPSSKLILDEESLLNVTARRAIEYGLASATVESHEELLALYDVEDEVMYLKLTWSESMFSFLANPLLQGLLMTGMLIGIFIELRTPGLGIPGLAALICFILLFGSSFFLGLSQWWAPAAVVLGLALLFLELFVTPGFGVLGISGILLMMLGMYGLFIPPEGDGGTPNFVPVTEAGWQVLRQGMTILPISFAAALAGSLLLGRFLPKLPLFGKLVLATADAEKVRVTAAGVTTEKKPAGKDEAKLPRVGQRGVVKSVLRPAGTVEVDGRLLDVVCDGDFVEPGERVRIAAIEGNRIIVEKVDK